MDKMYLYATGRMLQGDVFTPQTKNMNGGPLTDLKGNPKVQYFIGVGVPKTDPSFNETWAQMSAIAQAGFPGGESQRADFAWKVIDGDLPQHAQKPGFPGHWIFRFTSGFPVNAYTQGAAQQITDPNQIKRGYYIRIPFTAKANGNTQKPGLYLNMALVELIGYGEEISSGPDAAALLGAAGAAALPAGASATPVASATPLTPGPGQPVPGAVAPGQPVPGAVAPGLPVPGAVAPGLPVPGAVAPGQPVPGAVAPGQPVPGAVAPGPVPGAVAPGLPGAPAPGPVPGAVAPGPVPGAVAPGPVPGAPGVMPVAPAPDFLSPPVMTAAAGGATYESFMAQGWTDELLVQHGFMAARA